MPLIETKGAASAQGFGEFAKTGVATYIEDVFSTYLYTGNGSIQSIPNGINLGPNTGNSNYFNAGQINTNSSASAFDLGTSDWTVECWIKTSYTSRIDPFELNGGTSSGFFGLTLNRSASGDIEWNESSGGSSVAVITATGTTVANDSWHNIAVTRSGNSVRLFFDGTQVGSTYTTSYTYGGASKAFRFGNRYPGGISSSSVFYISNLRIVKGTALYTTTFTPSTQPLIQISGTSYLGAQSLSSSEDTTLIGNSYTNNVTPNGIGPFSYGTGSGGLVWVKGRNETYYHRLASSPGPTLPNYLASNATDAASSGNGNISVFNANGFTVNNNGGTGGTNSSGINYASWTFRKQPKFFDVVTYTGNGQSTARSISHNLGSRPGCIIVKRTDSTGDWWVAFDAAGNGTYYTKLKLNSTQASTGSTGLVHSSTSFTCNLIDDPSSYDVSVTNTNGATYVAYLFAHNAGGFGLTGTDNVISCGSFTTDGSGNATVSLGYEPQFVIIKPSSTTGNWQNIDVMRKWLGTNADSAKFLAPNLTNAEANTSYNATVFSTGFLVAGAAASTTYIYIAIRRGPMKVPTSGTSVFSPVTYTGNNTDNRLITSNFSVDMSLSMRRDAMGETGFFSRLTGDGQVLFPSSTAPEDTQVDKLKFGSNLGVLVSYVSAGGISTNQSPDPLEQLMFQRAPGFFDEVCYTGNGTAGATQTHNLGAVPEMMIVKDRNYSGGRPWTVYHSALGATKFTYMNQTTTPTTSSAAWNDTAPTASVFTLGSNSIVNFSGTSYVAYLFATCAGVSKVGSYTGTGALQTINCGFTGGARFVYIHRTDSTGDWYLYDSARGITSGNDPYVLLNSTAAEVTGTNYVDTDSTGFKVTAAAPAGLNASGGTYIFLAVA